MGTGEFNLGNAYYHRAFKANDANDLERCVTNMELALPHFREAARIYTAINHVDAANEALRLVVGVEVSLNQAGACTSAAATSRG